MLMKKLNLFALMAMLFSITLFTACSSDDDDEKKDDNFIIEGLGTITVNGDKWFVDNDEGDYYTNDGLGRLHTYIKQDWEDGMGYAITFKTLTKDKFIKGSTISDDYKQKYGDEILLMRANAPLLNPYYDYVSGTAIVSEIISGYMIVEFNNFTFKNTDIQDETYYKREYSITGKMTFKLLE